MEYSAQQVFSPYPPISSYAIILTGPTASGKTRVAMKLADRLDAEIVSIDSIAVYRGMDIGTAKPSSVDRQLVQHHLLDVVAPTEEYSVAQFLEHAARATEGILARGRRPLFVGGTPMYLKGLLYGFDPGPPADWEFRRAVETDIRLHGIDALHKRLVQVDPLSAARLPATDTRRITRALEVAYLTGIPLSHRQTQFERIASKNSAPLFAIRWPRELLHQRIEMRVASMFKGGLVDEVSGLLRQYGTLARTAATAVGYREVISHLDGSIPLETAMQEVLFHTRQLARRQETWFRSLPSLRWLEVADETALEDCVEKIVQSIGS